MGSNDYFFVTEPDGTRVAWFDHEPTDEDIHRMRVLATIDNLPMIRICWLEDVDDNDSQLYERWEKL